MIRIQNVDPKSSLKNNYVDLITSSTLAAVAGILPASCRLDRVYVGATAIIATVYVTVSLNGSAQTVIGVSSIGADGVATAKGAASPILITAGTLVEIAVSATAAFAAVAVLAQFELGREDK